MVSLAGEIFLFFPLFKYLKIPMIVIYARILPLINYLLIQRSFPGVLSSPNHPNHYDNDLDYWVHVVGPPDTRLVFVFKSIELEYQKDCLYDFIEVICGKTEVPNLGEKQIFYGGTEVVHKTIE